MQTHPGHEPTARTLPNGLTVLVEPMRRVRSAALSLLVPAGSVYDPPGRNAAAAVLCDLLTRGAGDLDNREFTAALDALGVSRSEGVGTAHLHVSAATVAENLPDALRLYRDLLRDPHLPEDEFEPARAGLAQSLRAIGDDPQHRVMLELRRRTYPVPWGLPTDGTPAGLESLTHADVLALHRTAVRPNGSILAVAGNVDPEAIVALAEELFGDWEERPDPTLTEGPRGPTRDHIDHESTQTQIALAYEAIPYNHPDYYAAWAAVSVLSGGMSSRLFTEVREKRGLCYSVSAGLNTLKHAGRVLCYAGTTAERAQETLDVTLHELRRLGEGVEPGELARCVSRAKSGLVMQQESTMSRAGGMARDWYHLGRVTTLEEVTTKIDALTPDDILSYVRAHPADDVTVLTLGPQPLEVPAA